MMRRASAQIERMQMQQAVRRAQAQTKAQQTRTQTAQESQRVDLAAKTAEAAQGGIQASQRRTMKTAGVASEAAQWSMQEISRFFERDARRYG